MRAYPEWRLTSRTTATATSSSTPRARARPPYYVPLAARGAAQASVARECLAPRTRSRSTSSSTTREQGLRIEPFVGFRRLFAGLARRLPSWLSRPAAAIPVAGARDAEQILARLAAFPTRARPGDSHACAKAPRSAGCRRAPCSTACSRTRSRQLRRRAGPRPVLRAVQPPRPRHPAAEQNALRCRRGAQIAETCCRAAPAARLRRRRYLPSRAGQRRARRLSRRRPRSTPSGSVSDDDRSDAGADPCDRPARARAPARRDGRGAPRGRFEGGFAALRHAPQHRPEVLPRQTPRR